MFFVSWKLWAARPPKAPERSSAVGAEQAVGVVLDHLEPVPVRDRQDRVHLAADTRVVHGKDGPRPGRDQRLQETLVEVERVRTDVDEDRARPAQHDRVRRGDEGERRHDHLVARTEVEEQGGELERRRAGRRQQHPAGSEQVLEHSAALLGEHAVAGDAARSHRLLDVADLVPGQTGAVERDAVAGHAFLLVPSRQRHASVRRSRAPDRGPEYPTRRLVARLRCGTHAGRNRVARLPPSRGARAPSRSRLLVTPRAPPLS